MINYKYGAAMALIIMSTGINASACESGLSITEVMGDGKILKLDDGSMWEVNDVDTIDSQLWLPMTDVVVCDEEKIINTEDNETVEVKKLR